MRVLKWIGGIIAATLVLGVLAGIGAAIAAITAVGGWIVAGAAAVFFVGSIIVEFLSKPSSPKHRDPQ